ncbi:MAG TPA: SBBP repeat-containing protein, partial [Ignavibacteria bacterium]|nr:SBBP repeat-containing protein [Ignavibacteria bacterium]
MDQAKDIAVDDSGNVYVTGSSEASTPNGAKFDYATIKYNSAGVMQWVQRYNGPGNDRDDVRAMVVDTLGNVYVTGLSNRVAFPGSADYDFATVKYDRNGVQQWVRRYNSGQDQAEAIGLDA